MNVSLTQQRRKGRPRQRPADHEQAHIRFSPALMAWLRDGATREYRSLNGHIEYLLERLRAHDEDAARAA